MNSRINRILSALSSYLYRQKLLKKGPVRIGMSHAADVRNSEDARSFCHVKEGSRKINCTHAIELLPDEFVAGILLHELAHIILNDMERGDPELQADEWILENVPESGYKYKDVSYWDETWRDAEVVECVSKKFLKTIGIRS